MKSKKNKNIPETGEVEVKVTKTRSLRAEMIYRIIIPIILIFIGTVLFLQYIYQSGSEDSINKQLIFQAETITSQAERFFEQNAVTVEQAAGDPITKAILNKAKADGTGLSENSMYGTMLQGLVNEKSVHGDTIMQTYIASLYINDLITDTADVLARDFPSVIVKERQWAIDTMNAKGTTYSLPYVDANTGASVCTISTPVWNGSDMIGLSAADIELTQLYEIFQNVEIGKNGFTVVFLPDDTTFYHPLEENIGVSIDQLDIDDSVKNAVRNQDTSTVIEYNSMGHNWLGVITVIGDTGWVMATNMLKAEAYATVKLTTLSLIAALIVALILIALVLALVARNITKPIMIVANDAEKLAHGDISFELTRSPRIRDEVDILMNSFADMVDASKEQAVNIRRIADGEEGIVIETRGDHDEINNSLIRVVDTLNALVGETGMLAENAIKGNTKVRGDASKFNGGYKRLIEGFNATLDAMMHEVQEMAGVVAALGKGELPQIENNAPGDFHTIIASLIASVEAIRSLVNDTQGMAQAALDGDYSVRADVDKYMGEFKNVIDGINKTLDMVVDKTVWYENIIDSIPMPVQVMDTQGKWILVNKPYEANLKAVGLVKNNASEIYGKPCHVDGVDLNGINALETQAQSVTRFTWGDGIFQQTTSYLKDKDGHKTGYVGSIQDLTQIIELADYTSNEIKRLEGNLNNLAIGNFEFAKSTQEIDDNTRATAEQFAGIDASLNRAATAVGAMVEDTKMMAANATEGNLHERIDASKFEGEFATVVSGINGLVDTILEPINEAMTVLQAVAQGNLQKKVLGDYKGDNAVFKDALNGTLEAINTIIRELSMVLSDMADGDLTVTINDANYKGDFTAIKDALYNIIDELKGVMQGLNESAQQVANGSRQLSEGAQTLANGSTKQASAVQQLSTTMSNVAAQTKQNTEDARRASTLSTDVMHKAEQGNSQMKDMLVSMQDINESSANISKIIKVIDDIAFQTNILALNAAVEAARAGVHGKGFAVVADEVRNLAAKSAQAASETTGLIEGSIAKVEAGTKIANATADALEEIVKGITETSNLCDAIANVSDEQYAGIEEVNTGIEQVSEVIQSNSATAQQSAASSEELYGQADMLKKMVATFKIDNKGSRPMSNPTPASFTPRALPNSPEEDIKITLDLEGNDKY